MFLLFTGNIDDYIFGQPINQADPHLMAAFKRKFLIPPPFPRKQDSPNEKQEDFSKTDIPTNIEKFEWVKKLLIENPNPEHKTTNGFFIECGANDGSFISPTIRLEKLYDWTGLLIEANPIPFEKLLEKKRNAYAVNTAVCITENPKPVTFYAHPVETGLSGLNQRAKMGVKVNSTVQCIPLYTMLAALELKTVDYLSLDVEGLELEILKTVPFDKVTFKVMTIEHWSIPGGVKPLKDFLERKGYRFIKTMEDSATRDSLYVHESLYEFAMSIKI